MERIDLEIDDFINYWITKDGKIHCCKFIKNMI